MNRPCSREGCSREAEGLTDTGRALCAPHLESAARRPVEGFPVSDTDRDGCAAPGASEGASRKPERKRRPSLEEMVELADRLTENERTPGAEAAGGASPEVETGDTPDLAAWAGRWSTVTQTMTTMSARLEQLQQQRRDLIAAMRTAGLSWAEIGEVTGLTRARLNQLYRAR